MAFPATLVFSALIIVAVDFVDKSESSAIPMWEYLSKDEKMSYLYSMFAGQVDEFCEFSELKNCHQELLKFGLKKLKGMPEDHLDTMDPYQRGANSIIWDSMMDGHEMRSKQGAAQRGSASTAKPNSYEDESFEGGASGLRGAASAKIDTVYRLPPPRGFAFGTAIDAERRQDAVSGIPQYTTYPSDGAFPGQRQQGFIYANTIAGGGGEAAPLTGPMVIKVHPDGKPVTGPQQPPLPHDEDLGHYRMSQAKIPDFY